MITRLLPALRGFLESECADLALSCPEKDETGNDTVRAPRVYIGDFPAKRQKGMETREFPCIVLAPVSGWAAEGLEVAEIAAYLCIYNNEEGDAEGMEMELALLQSAVSRVCALCLDQPLDRRFQLVPDERDRLYRWQRNGELETPRPYAQMVVVSRWTAPGWEPRGQRTMHNFPKER